MAGIGNATCRRRDEVPTPNLLDAARDHLVSTAFLAVRLGCPSRGPVASSVSRSGERTPGARRAASWGARGRIEGAGAHRARPGSVGRPARAEVSVGSGKKTGNPVGCADIRVAEAGFPGAVLLAIAVDIASNEVNARHARANVPPAKPGKFPSSERNSLTKEKLFRDQARRDPTGLNVTREGDHAPGTIARDSMIATLHRNGANATGNSPLPRRRAAPCSPMIPDARAHALRCCSRASCAAALRRASSRSP